MAKKKSDSPAAAPQGAAGKSAGPAGGAGKSSGPAGGASKKSAGGGGKTSAAAAAPLIDTNLAANAAAAMVAGKVGGASSAPAAQTGQPPRKESGMFKQLKAGLNKPSAGALGGAFTTGGPQKKSHVPFGGPKQVGGHNQTRGNDASRTGVPRRTPG